MNIIRDPPGGSSSATWKKGDDTSLELSVETNSEFEAGLEGSNGNGGAWEFTVSIHFANGGGQLSSGLPSLRLGACSSQTVVHGR